MNLRRWTVLVVVAAGVASSCTRDTPDLPRPSPPGPPPAGTIRLGYAAEPPTLDPVAGSGGSAATRDILRPVLPSLFGPAAEPELVSAWPSREDIRLDPFSVDLRLREASWSDGTPITADDVRFSWERLREGPTAGRYRFLRDVEVTGPRSLTLHFDRPLRRWWALFGVDDMVLPSHAYSPEWAHGPTVSGGPYAFDGWVPGLNIRLVRNEAYWGPVAQADAIDVLFVADDEMRLVLLDRGELDVASIQGEVNVGARAAARGFPVADELGPGPGTVGEWGSSWWELNLDPDRVAAPVGRALLNAADRMLAAEIFEDSGQVMHGIPARFPVRGAREWGVPAVGGPWEGVGGDLEAARRVLTAAGYRPGDELRPPRGGPVELRLAYPASSGAATLARFLHFQVRPLGLRVELIGVQADRFERDWLIEGRADAYVVLRRGVDAPDASAYRPGSSRPGSVPGSEDLTDLAESAVADEQVAAGPVLGLGRSAWGDVQRAMVDGATVVPLVRVRSWVVARGVVGPRPPGSAAGVLHNAGDWRLAG